MKIRVQGIKCSEQYTGADILRLVREAIAQLPKTMAALGDK